MCYLVCVVLLLPVSSVAFSELFPLYANPVIIVSYHCNVSKRVCACGCMHVWFVCASDEGVWILRVNAMNDIIATTSTSTSITSPTVMGLVEAIPDRVSDRESIDEFALVPVVILPKCV